MARPVQAPPPEPREANGNVAEPGGPQAEIAEDVPPVQVEVTEEAEPDVIEIEPVSVVDTTAELLGRAKPRAPRARAGRSSVASSPSTTSRGRATGTRKTAAKKPAAKKTAPKSRKHANKNDDDFGNR